MTSARDTSIASVLDKGNNSFGVIRLVLAILVIVSHSWSIGGFGFEPLVITSGGISLGLFAVSGFFCLSGLLVGLSAERSSPSSYFRRRAGRILPGYWVALVISGLVFGLLISIIRGLDVRNALLSPANGSVRTYIVNNFPLSASQYNVGRVLDGMPYPGGINGSLWSLPYEFSCYVLIFVLVKWAQATGKPTRKLMFLFGVSLLIAVLANKQGPIFVGFGIPILGTLDSRLFFNLWLGFLAGALLAHVRSRISVSPQLALASSAIVAASIPLDIFWPWGILAMPTALVGIAHYLPSAFRHVGDRVDISYGMYLYGFPVGQLIVALLGQESLSAPLLAALTIVTTLPFAYASWFGIERHFVAK
jgi:peptidoglycan/LPS O-acetylase OafA/YrhL